MVKFNDFQATLLMELNNILHSSVEYSTGVVRPSGQMTQNQGVIDVAWPVQEMIRLLIFLE